MNECSSLDRVTLVLTYQCNLDCPYCPLHNLRYISSPLSLQEWSRIIKELSEILDKDIPFFISGGEPTLNFDLLEHILAALSRYNRISVLVTNATLLDKNKIRILSRNKLNGLQATFHFYYLNSFNIIKNKLLNIINLLSYYKKLTYGIAAISLNINTKKDFIIINILKEISKKGYLKDIDLLEIAILNKYLELPQSLIQHILRLEKYTSVEIYHYGREFANICEIVITPDGFVIPWEMVYPKLLEDPRRVKYFYNVRKDDIRKVLSKEYLKTIRRIAMSWDAR